MKGFDMKKLIAASALSLLMSALVCADEGKTDTLSIVLYSPTQGTTEPVVYDDGVIKVTAEVKAIENDERVHIYLSVERDEEVIAAPQIITYFGESASVTFNKDTEKSLSIHVTLRKASEASIQVEVALHEEATQE